MSLIVSMSFRLTSSIDRWTWIAHLAIIGIKRKNQLYLSVPLDHNHPIALQPHLVKTQKVFNSPTVNSNFDCQSASTSVVSIGFAHDPCGSDVLSKLLPLSALKFFIPDLLAEPSSFLMVYAFMSPLMEVLCGFHPKISFIECVFCIHYFEGKFDDLKFNPRSCWSN